MPAEYSGFDGPISSRSIEMADEEEGYCVLKASPVTLCTGAMESNGVKVKCPEVFVEVLRNRRRFMEVDQNSVDKI